MVNFNFKRVMAALLMMAAMQVSAAVRPAAKDTALVKMYKDSLALYKAQLDSARTLNSAYTAFDKYKLFSSSTFYNDVAQEKLGLDGATKDSLNKEIDAALMNIYLKHPELIKVSETKLDEAGAVKQEIKEPIENKETIVEINSDGSVKSVPSRDHSRVAKAPQSFWLDDILKAHEQALKNGEKNNIDSCTLMQKYGKKQLHMVDGPYENIKITTPDDYFTMRAIFQAREDYQIYGFEP